MQALVAKIIEALPEIRKAIASGVAAATAYYGGAQLSGGTVSGLEWVALVLIGIGGGLLAWAVPNRGESPGGTTPGDA